VVGPVGDGTDPPALEGDVEPDALDGGAEPDGLDG
jgi:hypothetical protein